MRRRDASAVRCRAAFPVRRAFYDQLARAVLGARRPAGVVFEAVAPDPIPCALVRPARVLDDLRAFSRGSYDPLDFAPTRPGLVPLRVRSTGSG